MLPFRQTEVLYTILKHCGLARKFQRLTLLDPELNPLHVLLHIKN